jgi:hypothetical protein
MLTYAHVCSLSLFVGKKAAIHIDDDAHVCSRMLTLLTYAHVCSRMLTLLTYAHICSHMLSLSVSEVKAAIHIDEHAHVCSL